MEYNKYIDHTILRADATEKELLNLFEEAIKFNFKTVCINPTWIQLAKEKLLNSKVEICTVIGFPLGQMSTTSKIFEAQNVIKLGADEVDMVANISWIKDGKYEDVKNEIKIIKEKGIGPKTLKVIIETALLTKEEIEKTTQAVIDGGAEFVKTSTGFSTRGATIEDIKIMKTITKDKIEIKAAGGVKTTEDMINMIKEGATRIGTSRGVDLMKGIRSKKEGY